MKHCEGMYDQLVQSSTTEISKERFIAFAATQESLKLHMQSTDRDGLIEQRAEQLENAKSVVMAMRQEEQNIVGGLRHELRTDSEENIRNNEKLRSAERAIAQETSKSSDALRSNSRLPREEIANTRAQFESEYN